VLKWAWEHSCPWTAATPARLGRHQGIFR